MSALHTQEAPAQLAVGSPRQTKRFLTVLVGASILAAAVAVAINVSGSSQPEAAEITLSRAQQAEAARWNGMAEAYTSSAAASGIEHGPFTAYVPDLRSQQAPLYVGQDANLDPDVRSFDIPLFPGPGLPAGMEPGYLSRVLSGNLSITPGVPFGSGYAPDYGSSAGYLPEHGRPTGTGNKSVIAD